MSIEFVRNYHSECRGFVMARCMIVDDSSFMRRIIKQTLVEAGHEVVAEVDNGLEALEKYREILT